MKHTPGPWKIHFTYEDTPDGGLVELATVGTIEDRIGRCRQDVCQIYGWGAEYSQDEEQQANALLISKAPELLEALRELVEDEMSAALIAKTRALLAAIDKE
jgi:hypothetical protein